MSQPKALFIIASYEKFEISKYILEIESLEREGRISKRTYIGVNLIDMKNNVGSKLIVISFNGKQSQSQTRFL